MELQSRRASTDSTSPEFDFWRLQNPSCPQPDLASADDLFVDGVILPLRLATAHKTLPDPNPDPDESSAPDYPEPGSSAAHISAGAPVMNASKCWRDMFKKKKEQKVTGAASSPELNMNLWPFSRSRSAGNACTRRPKSAFGAPVTRKVNSAPCSRSNSRGESNSKKKWPASPGRCRVHLGRSSPVWQVRRGASGLSKTSETQVRYAEKEGNKTRRSKTTVIGGGAMPRVLNVPTCIGFRGHLSCRSDVMSSSADVGIRGGTNHRGGVAAAETENISWLLFGSSGWGTSSSAEFKYFSSKFKCSLKPSLTSLLELHHGF